MTTLAEDPTMTGYHFALARATVCMNCEEVFQFQRACPACASSHIEPIETFLQRKRAKEFEAHTLRELERAGAIKAYRIVGLKKEQRRAAG